MKLKRIKNIILFDTFGSIAISSLLICGFSGVILAIPYDVGSPYLSISSFLINNPGAVFFRNLHYWSAQIFLVFILLHIYDHFVKKSETRVKRGIWFRLTVGIIIILLAMISGFILKGDADSLQARRIMFSLIEKIPFIGNILAESILGNEKSFLIVYVHHIATFTIFIFIVLFEHARKLWGKSKTFLIILFFLIVLSIFFHAPLHDGIHSTLKGPWYFVGLQEILHWFGRPEFVIFFFLFVFVLIYGLKYFRSTWSKIIKLGLLSLLGFYFILTIIGFYFRGENWDWSTPWERSFTEKVKYVNNYFFWPEENSKLLVEKGIPIINDRAESCLVCHDVMKGFSEAHDPQAIGCAVCHLGNPFTIDKEAAHQRMIKIPGQIENAHITCGTANCHSNEVFSMEHSIMASASGLISVDKFLFGETDTFDTLFHIKQLGFSAAEKHLRDLCASCHLGNIKEDFGPINQKSRGGGCNACHLNYTKEAVDSLNNYLGVDKIQKNYYLTTHPSLDINISNDHCFGCHSRSGRISTNYEGWHETQLDKEDAIGKEGFRVLEDKRVFQYVQEDVHHSKGLLCIDCHSSHEVMGDGLTYLHKEEAVKITCEDCHFEEPINLTSFEDLDDETRNIFWLRNYQHEDQAILSNSASRPMVNTYMENDLAFLIGKKDGVIHPLNKPGKICRQGQAHDDLRCSACHTSWAPQCLGCHNAYEPGSKGYDLLDKKFVTGEWTEYIGAFYAEAPALGVKGDKENREIQSAIPGMIMTVDLGSYPDGEKDTDIIFHRLYAPASAHTITTKGRTCKSCHTNPLAIGYGRGTLIYNIEDKIGSWDFTPLYLLNPYDGLNEDAWIGFLKDKSGVVSTRSDFRPFNIAEQKRILTVGSCLYCHEESSSIINEMLDYNFQEYLQYISDECILPVFN